MNFLHGVRGRVRGRIWETNEMEMIGDDERLEKTKQKRGNENTKPGPLVCRWLLLALLFLLLLFILPFHVLLFILSC